ncbi:MAG: type II toxin-antitoxin system RelE/ParE family toxin [Ignavibacteriales bacterium]|nr:type II toxin-antitoxin system RelE/ParE family toxin [Ignavibacteriales bacterium]
MSRNKYTVRFLRIAEDDFAEIITYISADRPSAAEALAAKVEKNLQLLSQNPHLGRVPKEDELAQLHYRYLVVENYLIFYTVEGQTIYIHRILHGARDYLSLF